MKHVANDNNIIMIIIIIIIITLLTRITCNKVPQKQSVL